MPERAPVEVGGRTLLLSNLSKVLYPAAGFTKADVLDYYRRIAPLLLPHLQGRPLTLKRCPGGVSGELFYEKRCPSHRPAWMRTIPVLGGKRGPIDFCEVTDLASLIWIANLATLELHSSLSKAPALDRPTSLVFDLDPGAPAGLLDCAELGLEIRDVLERLGLQSFPKTSGNKGLQLYAPLDGRSSYEETKAFAHGLARLLEARSPDRVVSSMSKALRPGKVFIDWSQNDVHKTTICAYSLRARERPTISTPVTWDELGKALRRRSSAGLVFEAKALLQRALRYGDLFEPVLTLRQRLPSLPEWLPVH
ncbi:MAG: non-homologous end-joining DNA ligase [Deltaproteobacteria bacterium]